RQICRTSRGLSQVRSVGTGRFHDNGQRSGVRETARACMTLELDSSALPTLATNCVIVGHAQKADVVWTRDDFMALCEHMMNGNERNFFLIPYRKADGTAHFAK